MQAKYRDNPDRGPGYGIIVFSEALFPAAPWSISLQRSSDGKFLVPGGGKWVGESSFLSLEGSLSDDGARLDLFLDPQLVDSLDQQEQYRIFLKGSDGEPQKARLKLDSITFSRKDEKDNTARVSRKEKPAPPVPPNATASEAAPNNPEKPSTLTPPDAAENLEMASPPPSPAKSPKRWLFPLLALLALGALLAFSLMKNAPDKNTEPAPQSAAKKEESKKEEKKAESAEEVVKKFFAGKDTDSQTALALAKTLPKATPADQDAVYRLYYYAVGNNDPQAFLPYGDCLNPALPRWGSIVKNAPDAMEAYEKALQTNPEAARKAMDELLAWLEKQSAEGNAEAREWLARIKK